MHWKVHQANELKTYFHVLRNVFTRSNNTAPIQLKIIRKQYKKGSYLKVQTGKYKHLLVSSKSTRSSRGIYWY